MSVKKLILKKLKDRGIRLEDLIDSALELYEPKRELNQDKSIEKIKCRLKKIIENKCGDVNVSLLIEAAFHLDDEINRGVLEIKEDAASLICDELIGMSIAEYIGGKNALFNFVRYDTIKPGILSKLDIFLDDAVGGLIAGCMTRLFEEW